MRLATIALIRASIFGPLNIDSVRYGFEMAWPYAMPNAA